MNKATIGKIGLILAALAIYDLLNGRSVPLIGNPFASTATTATS